MTFDVPILFLIFNRPDTTARVFEKIREIKPQRLFIAADGPRPTKEGEREKCQEVRDLVMKNIDWPCEVKTLFRDQNLGCGRAVSGGISWFFDQVDEGIILEDDTLPANSFFDFCKTLLEKYRNESVVKMIGGSNYSNREIQCKSTYYFTAFPHIWGWATWKRTWQEYDFRLENIRDDEVRDLLKKYFLKKEVIEGWVNNYHIVKGGTANPWDFQLCFSILKRGGFNIVSATNIVTNIGFGADATHTSNINDELSNATLSEVTAMVHPEKIEIDKVQDGYTEMKVAGGLKPNTAIKKIINKFANMITGK
jgi:hypothetical protein